jgi:hypothetical protein
MTKIYPLIIQLSWALGLLSIVAAVIAKLFRLSLKLRVEPSTLLLVACTFFLCALATKALERT